MEPTENKANKTITLKIKGMHRKACEMVITDSLKELDGTIVVKASYLRREVNVTFNDKKLLLNKIKETIRKEGFEVE